MVLFLIKKTFCDSWDNLLVMAVWNVIISLCFIVCFFIVGVTVPPDGIIIPLESANFLKSLPTIISLIIATGLFMIPVFAVNKVTYKLAKFDGVKFLDFFKAIPSTAKDGFVFGAFLGLLFVLYTAAFPFYWNMWRSGSFVALFFCALLFWTAAIGILSLQWYMPLKTQMQGGFFKTLKKCFIIYFDNANFSFFMFFYIIVQILVSAIGLVFTLHGVSGITLSLNNALRLRLYKYDWMEEHPEVTPKEARKKVPWAELIAEDKEILGPRNFRSFLFPWT